ncbi:MAG: outer membrane protein assembly factor BamD [Gammaproteobacteria bacterium]|nr:outer membrane protein assembly factor BamD [Gammaproteobacteria bacterium]
MRTGFIVKSSRLLRQALLLGGVLLLNALSGCASDGNDEQVSARVLYEKAKTSMEYGQFETAIGHFESLESRFPFSAYALQAQLALAYAYYRFGQPDRAIVQADRFIRMNPTHPNVDYAYYLKGLANFEREKGFFDSWFPRDPADFELKPLQDAFHDFGKLVERFPSSVYAADAHRRMIYLRNELAEHEIKVAEFYLKRKAYIAAANRANGVLELFSETHSTQRALEILAEAYNNVNLPDQAAITNQVLMFNKTATTTDK